MIERRSIMKYCNNCGKQVNQGESFCSECGASLVQNINQVYNQQLVQTSNKPSSASTIIALVFGILSFCLAFIPIINNAGFILGVFSFILSFILLFKRGTKKSAVIIALLMAFMGMALTLYYQNKWSDEIDKNIIQPLDQTTKELDDYSSNVSGKNTDKLLKNNVEVTLGTFKISKGSYGIIDSKLPVKYK